MRLPLTIVIVLGVFSVSAVGGSYSEEQPSLISSLLDLLPEVETIIARNTGHVDAPRIRKGQIETIREIFDMFIPFMKEVIYNNADQTGEEVSEKTYDTIQTLERLFPKLVNLVVALSTRPQLNPDDEPVLPDYRAIAIRGRNNESPEEDGEGNLVQLPKVDTKVLKRVLNQTTNIFSQISRASTRGERKGKNLDKDLDSFNRPYHIGSSSTSGRPNTLRRRTPTTSKTTTQRTAYGTTAKLPRTYARTTTSAVSDDARSDESFGLSTSSEVDAGVPISDTPGAQVPFFTLLAARRRSPPRDQGTY